MSGKKQLISFLAIPTLLFGFLAAPAFAASSEKVLYSFKANGTDGANPLANPIFDADGTLYGTTFQGGASGMGCEGLGCGTVFRLVRGTNNKWSETVLYNFTGGTDGSAPAGSLIFDGSGNLYGTTTGGGAYGFGTVFELMPSAGGQWTETVLHSFSGGTDGYDPYAGLIFDSLGNLYGTTVGGGIGGGGTVFLLSASTGGMWVENVLYSFGTQSHDGGSPFGSLTFDAAGNLYSTVSHAGHRGGKAIGLVFQLTPVGDGSWTEKILYGCKFQGCPNQGRQAQGSVIFGGVRKLYGTTTQGGAYNHGVVFELTQGHGPDGKWKETVIHSFGKGKDGSGPQVGLIQDAAGNLYGTTQAGGAYVWGTVFRLTRGSNGVWTEKLLHNFGKGKDGVYAQSALIFDASGHLYGATAAGGTDNSGTVFEITP